MSNDDSSSGGKKRSGLGEAVGTYVQVEKIAQIALVLPCAVLIGWLGGTWLDHRFHQTWMTLTGFILGCIAGFTSSIRMAMALVKDPGKKAGPGPGGSDSGN